MSKWISKLLCNHEWDIHEITTESKFEHSIKVAESELPKQRLNIPHQMCDASRKVIQICTCKKCGKIKRFVTAI